MNAIESGHKVIKNHFPAVIQKEVIYRFLNDVFDNNKLKWLIILINLVLCVI